MSKVITGVLVLATLSLGTVYALLPSDESGALQPPSRQIEIVRSPAAPSSADVAPQTPARSTVANTAVNTPSAPVVVTLPRRAAESRARAATPQAWEGYPSDRFALARELQRELKRVGCYEGEVNGAWTPATRRAMKAFTDRVNATLPIEDPDQILLALVRSHQDAACGASCPAGQGLAENGQCIPNALLAQRSRGTLRQAAAGPSPNPPTKQATPVIEAWSTTMTASASSAPAALPFDGRMALAGPNSENNPAAVYNQGAPAAADPNTPAAQITPAPDAAQALARQRVQAKRTAFGPTLFRRLERSGP
jgi:hypothetical protein